MNGMKTTMLLAALTALFMALGYTLGGSGGAVPNPLHNLGLLYHLAHLRPADSLVAIVVKLAEDASMKAWHAGVIANSAIAEALTSGLIFMNGRYKIDGAGIRITGTPGSAAKD